MVAAVVREGSGSSTTHLDDKGSEEPLLEKSRKYTASRILGGDICGGGTALLLGRGPLRSRAGSAFLGSAGGYSAGGPDRPEVPRCRTE